MSQLPDHPQRVLVVDNEYMVATGLARDLEELGYEVVALAADGEEAIRRCHELEPDLVLLDIRMPHRDGVSTAEQLHREFAVAVVFCTAFPAQEYVDAANRYGVHGYILKPVTKDNLRIEIAMAWGRYLEGIRASEAIEKLETRLEHRKIIEKAKWIVVERREISEPEAMRLLQRQARNNRRRLVDVAQSIIDNAELI